MSELVQHWYSLVQAFGTASAEEQEELPEDIRDMLSEYAKMSKAASAACGPAHESTFKHVTLGLGFEIAESFDVLCHLARKRIVSAAAQLPVAFSVELEASAGKIQSCKALNSFWEIHAEVSGLWRNIVKNDCIQCFSDHTVFAPLLEELSSAYGMEKPRLWGMYQELLGGNTTLQLSLTRDVSRCITDMLAFSVALSLRCPLSFNHLKKIVQRNAPYGLVMEQFASRLALSYSQIIFAGDSALVKNKKIKTTRDCMTVARPTTVPAGGRGSILDRIDATGTILVNFADVGVRSLTLVEALDNLKMLYTRRQRLFDIGAEVRAEIDFECSLEAVFLEKGARGMVLQQEEPGLLLVRLQTNSVVCLDADCLEAVNCIFGEEAEPCLWRSVQPLYEYCFAHCPYRKPARSSRPKKSPAAFRSQSAPSMLQRPLAGRDFTWKTSQKPMKIHLLANLQL